MATRNIPSIHILMSLDEIDPKTPGYQHSKTRTTFWLEADGKGGSGTGPRKGGNHFTGPQLNRKPNRHYEGDKNGAPNGQGGGGGGRKKNRNKNKAEKSSGEKGDGQQKVQASGSGGNRAKKVKQNENKPKADPGEGTKSEKGAADKQSMEIGE